MRCFDSLSVTLATAGLSPVYRRNSRGPRLRYPFLHQGAQLLFEKIPRVIFQVITHRQGVTPNIQDALGWIMENVRDRMQHCLGLSIGRSILHVQDAHAALPMALGALIVVGRNDGEQVMSLEVLAVRRDGQEWSSLGEVFQLAWGYPRLLLIVHVDPDRRPEV